MILLLGGTGYIGQAFASELRRRNWEFRAVSRSECDYSRFGLLSELLQQLKPEFLVNCAGFTGKPNVDACEVMRAETLQGNTLLPLTIAHACEANRVPWGHVSSGCIYAGAKVADENGKLHAEKDLLNSKFKKVLANEPDRLHGFTEEDAPNFSFRDGPCSFYSGTKALGEEAILGSASVFVWRLRIPFDEFDNNRNYLSKVQRYAKVYDNVNSISHRADFARGCLDLWKLRAPPGIYNVVNPGFVTTRQVVGLIEKHLRPARRFEFWESDEEFYAQAAKTPRSNCILDAGKLLKAGVSIRPVEEALDEALRNWKPEPSASRNQ